MRWASFICRKLNALLRKLACKKKSRQVAGTLRRSSQLRGAALAVIVFFFLVLTLAALFLLTNLSGLSTLLAFLSMLTGRVILLAGLALLTVLLEIVCHESTPPNLQCTASRIAI